MATSSAPNPAPWRSLFQEHISKMEDPYMAVSTVARDPTTGKSIPRVRYCGFRSFFGELKLHPSAEKQLEEQNDKNPPVFESDMLSFTTDVRMEKVGQLADFNGAIEVVFFVKEAMTQWRVSGTAFVIGDSADQKHEQYARKEIQKGLRRRQGESSPHDDKQWTWEKEVTMYFANHSPVMRGSYRPYHIPFVLLCSSFFLYFSVHNPPIFSIPH
jgi:pyridoxamine 5'-phosphate oxidase